MPTRLANTISFLVDGADSITLLAGLDLEGICASSGSACSAGSLDPHTLFLPWAWRRDLANSLVRFSLGRQNTQCRSGSRRLALLPTVISRAKPVNGIRIG